MLNIAIRSKVIDADCLVLASNPGVIISQTNFSLDTLPKPFPETREFRIKIIKEISNYAQWKTLDL